MQNISKRLIAILIVAVLMISTLAMVACDETFEFTYPELPAKGDLASNGGIAVQYGEYVYYINGTVFDPDTTNKYTGEAKYGDIVRIATEDLDAILETSLDNTLAKGADMDELIADSIREKVELVVPMFYYTDNKTDITANGLYIFNDRLYFTTPNDELTANGIQLSEQAVIYSATLDGKDLTREHVVENGATPIYYSQKGEDVLVTYLGTTTKQEGDEETDINQIVTVNLTTDDTTAIAEEVTSVKYDKDNLYYINVDGSIATANVGGEEEVLVENKDKDAVTYTITAINQGKVYYTVSDTAEPNLSLYMVETGKAPIVILNSTADYNGTAYKYLPYGDGVLMVSKNMDSDAINMYLTKGDISAKTYVIKQNSNEQDLTLVSLVGDILTFTDPSNVIYTVDLTGTLGQLVLKAEDGNGKTIADSSIANWAKADIVGEYVFSLDDESNVVCNRWTYNTEDKAWGNDSIVITLLPKAE